jgi:hypothetical protein
MSADYTSPVEVDSYSRRWAQSAAASSMRMKTADGGVGPVLVSLSRLAQLIPARKPRCLLRHRFCLDLQPHKTVVLIDIVEATHSEDLVHAMAMLKHLLSPLIGHQNIRELPGILRRWRDDGCHCTLQDFGESKSSPATAMYPPVAGNDPTEILF